MHHVSDSRAQFSSLFAATFHYYYPADPSGQWQQHAAIYRCGWKEDYNVRRRSQNLEDTVKIFNAYRLSHSSLATAVTDSRLIGKLVQSLFELLPLSF